jgi:hypothetical protein
MSELELKLWAFSCGIPLFVGCDSLRGTFEKLGVGDGRGDGKYVVVAAVALTSEVPAVSLVTAASILGVVFVASRL